MRFEIVRDGQRELGARIEDVAQDAIDATALAYAHDASIDVEEHLRAQFSSRAIGAADGETLIEVGREIRAGRHPSVGWQDGPV
jgi:hypothetical protein